jgi:hypothetical protein
MTFNPAKQARQDLAELRTLIEDSRQELGIADGEPSGKRIERGGFFRRAAHVRRRRQAPVA